MRVPVLQDSLPHVPWMEAATARLPGMRPCGAEDWIRADEAFAGQMAERDWLIATRLPLVHALLPEGRVAAEELLEAVLEILSRRPGYAVGAGAVTRPDGVVVPLDGRFPMVTLGRLVQEDLCLMERRGEESVMTGAILCFPASWTLAQKIGKPMTGIHRPVAHYDAELARRVQRLFDMVRPGQPMERYNALVYDDPTLHQPRVEGDRRPYAVERLYMRSERQVIARLPRSGAVVFSIHTYIVPLERLSPEAREAMAGAGL
ncbi:heme-dependent oxidative N-demethylase family protein [Tabrizicola sp. M-4]|uniref:heme-dependent oxidative N-demethylase family protein n=1 Tax=Tabrizicola sp. M-4 TaxID=3055847 RepID=UPI003DA9599A